jgi:hypothetical protein
MFIIKHIKFKHFPTVSLDIYDCLLLKALDYTLLGEPHSFF